MSPVSFRYLFLSLLFIFSFAVFTSSPAVAEEVVSWECRVQDNNNGCNKTIRAPSGKKIVAVSAACNLEHGAVTNSELASVPKNTIEVVRASDRHWPNPNGHCFVGSTKIGSGKKKIQGVNGVQFIRVGCKEHDKNGGDCHIKGFVTLANGGRTSGTPTTPTGNRVIVKSVCGVGNCPIGFHSTKFSRSPSCPGNGISPNQTICQNNVGASFYQCSVGNCPSGYRQNLTRYSASCSLGNTLSHN